MMKLLAIVAVVLTVTHAAPLFFKNGEASTTRWHELEGKNYGFEDYETEFGKKYESEAEREMRKTIFEKELLRVKAHNRDTTKTWKEGVNHLSDLTDAEFKSMLGYKWKPTSGTHRVAATAPTKTMDQLPYRVDWREQGAVTPTKDQGRCGSCWTFATAETVESHWFLKTGQLVELSEEQVASCTSNPQQCGGTGGCEGGTAEVGFQGIIDAGGIASEWTYPYNSYNGSDYACNDQKEYVANISSYVKLPENEYEPLMTALATMGPIAISAWAGPWKSYEGGVFDGCQGTPDIDHAIQLVGYGTDAAGGDYWLVRNSWSPSWGEGGYIRIKRQGASPTCAVDVTPSHGSGCSGGPSNVTVCGTCGVLYDTAYPLI